MSKKDTKAWKILEFIGSKGEEGVGLTEIQHFIWTKLDGYSEEDFQRKEKARVYSRNGSFRNTELRVTRGHWCTALYGGYYYHTGLLNEYCKKNDKNKWVLDHMPKPKENIYQYSKRKDFESSRKYWY